MLNPKTPKAFLMFSLICVAHPSVFAQTTWNDLNFGASLADVRQLLLKQGLTLEGSDVVWTVKPGWDFKPPGEKMVVHGHAEQIVLHFTPLLYFSDADKLERIALEFREDPALTLAERSHAMGTAVKSTHEQLIEKYGKPATEAGACTSADSTDFILNPHTMDCKATWKADKQTVSLSWTYYGEEHGIGKLLLEITYVPAQSGGL
jgi:hypothetical protein